MELPRKYPLVRKTKSQGQDLGEIPVFQEMVEEEMLVKEIELDQPKRLKISEDNRVTDAKGPQVGVAIWLFQRQKWNLGGSGTSSESGIHWSPRYAVLPAAPRLLCHSGSFWKTDAWFLFLDTWLSGEIRKEGLELSYALKFRSSLYYNAGCSFTFLCMNFFTGNLMTLKINWFSFYLQNWLEST